MGTGAAIPFSETSTAIFPNAGTSVPVVPVRLCRSIECLRQNQMAVRRIERLRHNGRDVDPISELELTAASRRAVTTYLAPAAQFAPAPRGNGLYAECKRLFEPRGKPRIRRQKLRVIWQTRVRLLLQTIHLGCELISVAISWRTFKQLRSHLPKCRADQRILLARLRPFLERCERAHCDAIPVRMGNRSAVWKFQRVELDLRIPQRSKVTIQDA